MFVLVEISDKVKCAAVFAVYKNRDEEGAVREAWDLEIALAESAGYGLWLCEGRTSVDCAPKSVALDDIRGFNHWFLERKMQNDIHGVYIMIMYFTLILISHVGVISFECAWIYGRGKFLELPKL